jgi:hypothetical protein
VQRRLLEFRRANRVARTHNDDAHVHRSSRRLRRSLCCAHLQKSTNDGIEFMAGHDDE